MILAPSPDSMIRSRYFSRPPSLDICIRAMSALERWK
jgi:hypothetical protein